MMSVHVSLLCTDYRVQYLPHNFIYRYIDSSEFRASFFKLQIRPSDREYSIKLPNDISDIITKSRERI